MPRSDELVDIVKARLVESHLAELDRLADAKTPYAFRRKAWLRNQVQRLQFELGQYELAKPDEVA
jgi:hypothetical protein